MDVKQLLKRQAALSGNTHLLRRTRRLRAANALAKDASLGSLDVLLDAIMSGTDSDAAQAASTALSTHADWRHINIICTVWALTRHPTLGRLISQHGWIANAPPDARVLSALHIGQLEVLVNARPGLIPALLLATGDRNQTIAQRARRSLLALQRSDAKQALCMLGIEQQLPLALDIAQRAHYLPEEMSLRALYLLLTHQQDAFRAIDPDCTLIVKAYVQSGAELRKRINDALNDEPNAPPLLPPSLIYVAHLNDAQWQEAVNHLQKPANHHIAAVVTRYAPARWAARLLVHLDPSAEPASRNQTMPLDVLRKFSETCLAGAEPFPQLQQSFQAGQRGIHHLALSPDGLHVAAADGTGALFVWRISDGSERPAPPTREWPVKSMVFSRDGAWLCSAASVGNIHIWDMQNHRTAQQFAGRAPLHLVADSDTLMSGGEDAFHFWSMQGSHLSTIGTPGARIAHITVSDDQQYYAVSGAAPSLHTSLHTPRDHAITLWRMPSGELLAGDALSRWLDRGDPIARLSMPCVAEQVVFSPNGQLIAAVGGDGVVRVWRVLDGLLQQSYPGTAPLVFLHEGAQLLSGSATSGFQIRFSYSGELLANIPLPHGIPHTMTAIPQRGMLVAGNTDGTITLWRLHESYESIELTKHEHRITALTLSSDGRTLASADVSGAIHIWDMAVNDLIRRIPLHIRPADRSWISDAVRQRRYKGDERRWLELMNALNRTPPGNRRGYDPSIPVDIGSFRLRLE